MRTEAPDRTALCVDLDGTLIASDLLYESAARYVTQNPLRLLRLAAWLLKGRRHLKERLAELVVVDAALLPYREPVVELVRTARAQGRPTYLVTAAAADSARRVADHLGVFDEVIASDEAHGNLAGERKAAYLVERFGEGGYTYIGDSSRDLPVWRSAGSVVAVGPSARVRRVLAAGPQPVQIVEVPQATAKTWRRQLRIHQAAKNLLVLIPLLLAHEVSDWQPWIRVGLTFLAFTALSLGTYIMNDLHDLEKDRRHPTKYRRPLASGLIPIPSAVIVSLTLVLIGLLLALAVGLGVLSILLGYYALTMAYSLYLRRIVLLDVLALAALYTIRIFAGGVAAQVELTLWVVLTSVFLFFSLALMKRYSEFTRYDIDTASGRGYIRQDRPAILAAGISSGMLSVLVIAMYVDSDVARSMYATPEILWILVPLLLFWITRMWLLAERGVMHDDPVAFAIRDRTSQAVVLLGGAIVVAAALVGR